MSNTNMEFGDFMNRERSDGQLSQYVGFVNGAQGGMTAAAWANPPAANNPWPVLEQRIAAAGYSDSQVQVAWIKEADFTTSVPSFQTYAHTMVTELSQITSVAAKRYPNLRQVFVSTRTYAGYSGIYPGTTIGPNPEPWAYETGFAVKWFVAQSVANPGQRPWVSWGPYLWTDGTRGRADGLQWFCSDTIDGTHPSTSGLAKIYPYMHNLFVSSAFTPWFGGSAPVQNPPPGPSPTALPSPVASPIATPAGAPPPVGGVRPTNRPPGQISRSPVPVSTPGSSPPASLPADIRAVITAAAQLPPAGRWSLLTIVLIAVGGAFAAVAWLVTGRRWRRPSRIRNKPPASAGTNGSGPPPEVQAKPPEARLPVGAGRNVGGSGEDHQTPTE
jgi:hypothetical protein